jgi:hypothetical protein
MPNHVHIVGVPAAEGSLANVFRTVYMHAFRSGEKVPFQPQIEK